MEKHFKSEPGSPTEPVSTNVTRVQNNVPQPPITDQEMNKPFALALSVPYDGELSAVSLLSQLKLAFSLWIVTTTPCTRSLSMPT